MARPNANYQQLILNAGLKNWEKNQKKMLAKGVSKESYILGYLHGYSTCYDTYDIGEDEHPPERK